MARIAVLGALALAACAAAPLVGREGAPVALSTPQAAEQCAAQPELDWCGADRR